MLGDNTEAEKLLILPGSLSTHLNHHVGWNIGEALRMKESRSLGESYYKNLATPYFIESPLEMSRVT